MQNNTSVCTIVKNGMDTLPMWLKWASDNFPEINVVCDTVNEDHTLDYLTQIERGGTPWGTSINLLVHPFDDFSSQKQRAYDMCTLPYSILIDADEIMEEMAPNGIENIMDKTKANIGVLRRFNLQKTPRYYNNVGYPDFQYRVIRTNSGVKMNGKPVDEALARRHDDVHITLPWSIIHFGHIRPLDYLLMKGRDRVKFASDDNCDGAALKEHGENWFVLRNVQWESNPDNLEELPREAIKQIERYWVNNIE